jgi:uncharacterized protein YaeQ
MALPATVHRFTLDLSHVERDLYRELEVQVARHPSESLPFLVTRVLAYAYLWEEGMAFSRGGLSDTDEPALSVRGLDGRWRVWVEVGVPSAERVHRGAKASPRVVVFTHRRPQVLLDALRGQRIHREEQLEIYAVDEPLLQALGERLAKRNAWGVTFTGGVAYITVDGETLEGAVARVPRLPGGQAGDP